MYLMSCTRPDLAYVVSRLSRYTRNPSAEHWKSITRLLRYLRYTRNYGLHYGRDPAGPGQGQWALWRFDGALGTSHARIAASRLRAALVF